MKQYYAPGDPLIENLQRQIDYLEREMRHLRGAMMVPAPLNTPAPLDPGPQPAGKVLAAQSLMGNLRRFCAENKLWGKFMGVTVDEL